MDSKGGCSAGWRCTDLRAQVENQVVLPDDGDDGRGVDGYATCVRCSSRVRE